MRGIHRSIDKVFESLRFPSGFIENGLLLLVFCLLNLVFFPNDCRKASIALLVANELSPNFATESHDWCNYSGTGATYSSPYHVVF